VIKPTNGRVVWYYPDGLKGLDAGDQPRPATVAYVHSDNCINIGYLDVNGNPKNATSVRLLQDDEPAPAFPFAMWMPYQKGQAAKTEQLEKQVAGA
jgi:hypothetical protein